MLHEGENIIWVDRPESGIKFRKLDLFLLPFSFAWGGFAVFWEYLVWQEGMPWVFKLFGIPFVLIGLYLMVGRLYHDKLIRDHTVYGISDRGRVLIKSGIFKKISKQYEIRTLDEITVSGRRGTDGSIIFSKNSSKQSQKGAWLGDYGKQFAHIQHVGKVHDLLMRYRN